MAKTSNIKIDKELVKANDLFIKNIESNMYFKSEVANNSMSFDWVDEFEFACNYIDNIVRNPKYVLIDEESTVKIEKAKKITVASIKDLSRHTNYIEEIDKNTDDVRPSKILIVNKEETFNIYENRVIFTLINNMIRFMNIKEKELKNLDITNEKNLEYSASTIIDGEKVNISLNVNSKQVPDDINDNKFTKEIKQVKKRIKRIKQYITSWQRSEFMKQLTKAHVPEVKPPVTKTNIILKNPNFQVAMRLWVFLQTYNNELGDSKTDLDTKGTKIIKAILDDNFLINYYVLDSISSSKKLQKEKLSKYAILMIRQNIQLAMGILLNSGIEISEEEILKMIADEMAKEKEKIASNGTVVKNKFKDAMKEYLERIQNV